VEPADPSKQLPWWIRTGHKIPGGHIRLLHFARRQGDWLVVAINSDASVHWIKSPSRPIIPAKERAEMLFALRCVDDVQIFDDDTPEPLIRRLRPAVIVKGPACQRTTGKQQSAGPAEKQTGDKTH
jgi:rfaE bifunctional protein nucleotidyltransferase chain/domain